MKHTVTVPHYNGSHQQLAEQMGDLYYNALAELLTMLADKLERDAAKDNARGRLKLASELAGASTAIKAAAAHINTAWRICEPYMSCLAQEELKMTSWSQDVYIKALLFAANAHNGQKVPGTDFPYLTHLSMVSMEVTAALAVEEGLDGNLAIQCALLHDVLEDTSVAHEALLEIFGETVTNGVQALTKHDDLPKHEKMADSLARIQQQPREVWMVKLADRITNLQPPPRHWTTEKMQSYQQEARQIYDALHGASPFLAARLKQKTDNYDQYFSR